eukprot:3135298-Lingulodinium_polyedra.AAC.1
MDTKDSEGQTNSEASPRSSPRSLVAGESVACGRGTGNKWRRAKGGNDGAPNDQKNKQDSQGMPAPKARKAKPNEAPPVLKDMKAPITMGKGGPAPPPPQHDPPLAMTNVPPPKD